MYMYISYTCTYFISHLQPQTSRKMVDAAWVEYLEAATEAHRVKSRVLLLKEKLLMRQLDNTQ